MIGLFWLEVGGDLGGGGPLRNVLVILEGRVIGNHVDLTETGRERKRERGGRA